ncbi:MAG: hypothetical protein ACP6IP_01205 [Candidatus Njordarchaeia archaeon]
MNENDPSKMEGLVIVIEEKQKGTMDHEGKDIEYESLGKINIYNNTGSPIFDLTLFLENVDKTSLKGRKELTIGIVRHEEGRNTHTIAYSIADVPKAVILSEKIQLPPDLPVPIAYLNEDLPITIKYLIANKWKSKFTVNMQKKFPEQIKIKTIPTLATGILEKEDNTLNASDIELGVGDTLEIDLETTFSPATADAFRSGVVIYRYHGDEVTISDLEIKEVHGTLKINSHIDKIERTEERGIWDCYVVVENTTKAEIMVAPEIEIKSGTLLEESGSGEFVWNLIKQHPGLRSYDTVVFERVLLKPGETKKIGPFTLRSDEEPKLSSEVKTVIIPKIIKKLDGEFTIEDVEVPVFSGVVEKTVKVSHPPYIHGMTEGQLVAHLEETINVETYVENRGSAKADYIKFVENIPKDIIPPKRTGIRVFFKKGVNEIILPAETLNITIDPDDMDPSTEHKLVIEVKDLYTKMGEFFEKGDRIIARYQLGASNLTEPNNVYEFPTEVHMATAIGTKPLVLKLAEVPKLETLTALRKVVKSKDVILTETKDEYIVVILLKNEGDLPVTNYEFVDKVPLSFELIEEKVDPEPSDVSEVRDGLILKWVIKEIPAKEEVKVEYMVRGRPGHKVSDLYKIYEGE